MHDQKAREFVIGTGVLPKLLQLISLNNKNIDVLIPITYTLSILLGNTHKTIINLNEHIIRTPNSNSSTENC